MRERLRAEGFSISGDTVQAAPVEPREDSEEFELLETGGPDGADGRRPRLDRGAGARRLFRGGRSVRDHSQRSRSRDRVAVAGGGSGGAACDAGREDVEFVVVDDGEFADLAEEVAREIETAGAAEPVEVEAPTVEEIVASFKQGVAENLSPEDYDTHYNLGIAYREMGLIEEAIGEFEIAIKSPDYMIGCCSLLGLLLP